MSCLPTFKSFPKYKSPSVFNSRARYNAQVRSTLPVRPLFLSTRSEYDPAARVTTPQPTQARLSRNGRDEDETGRRAPTPSRMMRQASRFPTTASINSESTITRHPRDNWSTSNLNPEPLAELFAAIHTTLAHVPYAICGLGALVDHGFTSRRLTQVSILSPAYAKDNVRAWLAARGYDTFGDSVGIPVGEPDQDGQRQVRRVRIKYLDEGFDRLERVKSSVSDAWILSLASQLDHAAAGFVDHYRRQQQRKKGDAKTDEADDREERALRSISRDVFFCLDKAARTRQALDPRLLPTLLGEEFWTPFTARHDDARTEMARAGIDVATVLAKHRDAQAVREHEEMLRQFGGLGLVAEQPGPFEGMRTLGDANTKSVYSVASSSAAYANDGAPPPVPPLPARSLLRRQPTGGRSIPTRKPVPQRSTSLREGREMDGKGTARVGLARGGSARLPPREPTPGVDGSKEPTGGRWV